MMTTEIYRCGGVTEFPSTLPMIHLSNCSKFYYTNKFTLFLLDPCWGAARGNFRSFSLLHHHSYLLTFRTESSEVRGVQDK